MSGDSEKSSEKTGYFMYVVRCSDGTFYTGYATDVERRVATHNAGAGAKYTRTRRPVELVAHAGFATKHEALSAEYHFKRLGRADKDALLAKAQLTPFEDVLAQAFDLGIKSEEATHGGEKRHEGPDGKR